MREFLGRSLLVCGGVVGTLLVVDLVFLLVNGPVRTVEDFYEPDARFGYRMRPNLEFVFASPYHGYHATVRTNELGLHDDPVSRPKPPGTFRVLLIGDSMTAGLEVDKDETFEAVCERLLGARRPTEVVNAGVRGYNLDNIVGYLDAEGLDLEPDLVVYVFTDNDLTSENTFSPEGTDISRGFSLHGFLGRVATYSHIAYRIEILRQRMTLRRLRDQPRADATSIQLPGGIVAFFTNSDWMAHPAFILTARRIEHLARACAARGVPFLLAGAPQREAIDPESRQFLTAQLGRDRNVDFDGMSRYLDWVASKLGVARFDPTPDFRTRLARDGDYWFHKDGHLNARGHRLLGELFAARIESLLESGAVRVPGAR
jgi:lysophospholipase L1-like esterase